MKPRRPKRTLSAEAASEDFARTEGSMGKDKAAQTSTRAHDEPGWTQ